MFHRLRRLLAHTFSRRAVPYPIKLWRGTLPYSYYGYGIYHAADLAQRLGISHISVIEFGVAGGNGLIAMEAHAEQVSRLLGVAIDVFGFDTGVGLLAPKDYRDMPYRFAPGNYSMEVDILRPHLKRAKLILGDVKDTTQLFLQAEQPAPIAFVAFDMDFYSSTVDALQVFAESQADAYFLPRVQLYFDDIVGLEISSYNEFVGEMAAIRDFNASYESVKIAQNRRFLAHRAPRKWHHKMFIMHRFAHCLYGRYISTDGPNSLSLLDEKD